MTIVISALVLQFYRGYPTSLERNSWEKVGRVYTNSIHVLKR